MNYFTIFVNDFVARFRETPPTVIALGVVNGQVGLYFADASNVFELEWSRRRRRLLEIISDVASMINWIAFCCDLI